jgi:hypothetical protein
VEYTKEQNDLMAHVRHVTMTDDQLAYIEEFCAKIRTSLDQADFNAKRQIIELLDIRGKIAFENGQKVVYLKCLIDPKEQQQRLPIQILPSQRSHTGYTVELTARLVLAANMSLADMLLLRQPRQNIPHENQGFTACPFLPIWGFQAS